MDILVSIQIGLLTKNVPTFIGFLMYMNFVMLHLKLLITEWLFISIKFMKFLSSKLRKSKLSFKHLPPKTCSWSFCLDGIKYVCEWDEMKYVCKSFVSIAFLLSMCFIIDAVCLIQKSLLIFLVYSYLITNSPVISQTSLEVVFLLPPSTALLLAPIWRSHLTWKQGIPLMWGSYLFLPSRPQNSPLSKIKLLTRFHS